MKKLVFLLFIMVGSLAFGQEDVPYKLFGVYKNLDGEILSINRDLDGVVFVRSKDDIVLATGTIALEDGELHIKRKDTDDSYNLSFFVGTTNIVIYKPRSTKAWLWYRIR